MEVVFSADAPENANSPEFKAACEKIDAPVIFLDPAQYRQYVIENYKKETILIEKLQLKKLLAS